MTNPAIGRCRHTLCHQELTAGTGHHTTSSHRGQGVDNTQKRRPVQIHPPPSDLHIRLVNEPSIPGEALTPRIPGRRRRVARAQRADVSSTPSGTGAVWQDRAGSPGTGSNQSPPSPEVTDSPDPHDVRDGYCCYTEDDERRTVIDRAQPAVRVGFRCWFRWNGLLEGAGQLAEVGGEPDVLRVVDGARDDGGALVGERGAQCG
jgi:hypothetical protein